MRIKNPKLIEEVDAEVVNRQPNAQERREISAFLSIYKKRLNVVLVQLKSGHGSEDLLLCEKVDEVELTILLPN